MVNPYPNDRGSPEIKYDSMLCPILLSLPADRQVYAETSPIPTQARSGKIRLIFNDLKLVPLSLRHLLSGYE
jgi:hypothetical protein